MKRINKNDPIVKKFAPFLGVLGAILLFASWAVNSAIVEKHKKNTAAMSNVITQKRMFEYLNKITSSQNDQLHKLQNLEGKTDIIVQDITKNPLIKGDRDFFQYLQNSGRINADYERILNLLNDSQVLADLSELVSLPNARKEKIDSTVGNISSFYREYYEKKKELEKKVITPGPGAGGSWWKTSEQVRVNEEELDKIEDKYYLKLINEVYGHYAFLYKHAKNELRNSARLSKHSGTVSVSVYVIGSLLIILGRWWDYKSKIINS